MKRCSHSKEMDLLLPVSHFKNMKNFNNILSFFFYDDYTNRIIRKNLSPLTKTFPHNLLDQKFELNSQFRAFYQIDLDEDNDPAYSKYIHYLFDNFLYYKSRYTWYKAEGGLRDKPRGEVRPPTQMEQKVFEKIRLVEEYNLTHYDIFNTGRVKMEKEERKLFRFCKQNDLLRDDQIDQLNTEKTKGGLFLCISRNPVDYLFASTGQSFGSCISLESEAEGCFYMGLAGLAADPNRFLIFVTNGAVKRYHIKGYEFKHFKYISRSWGIMGKHDRIHVVGAYPADKIGLTKQLSKIGYDTRGIVDSCKESLFSFEIPKHEDGTESSIYMDGPGLTDRHNRNGSGKWYHSVDGICGSLCDFSFGGPFEEISCFDTLLRDSYYCDRCDRRVHEDNSYYHDHIGTLCEICYEEYYFSCYHCGEVEDNDDAVIYAGDWYCMHCADSLFERCDECGDYIRERDTYWVSDTPLCAGCCDDLANRCTECGDWYFKDDLCSDDDGDWYCDDCFTDKFGTCDGCHKTFLHSELESIDNWELLCEDCAVERSEDEVINDAV